MTIQFQLLVISRKNIISFNALLWCPDEDCSVVVEMLVIVSLRLIAMVIDDILMRNSG